MKTLYQKYTTSNSSLDIIVFLIITALAVYSGQSTVFYILYFFWWNELICVVVDKAFNRFIWKTSRESNESVGPFFLMFIYFIFIVLFFGIFANIDNTTIFLINLEILFFKNWFFNLNLLYILLITIRRYRIVNESKAYIGAFSSNMIILHISIILGAFMMFFVVRSFPDFFTPTNLLGSVLIISPFLLLRFLFHYLSLKKNK